MPAIALFFTTKAQRDIAYAALRPLITGDDHGVSGGDTDRDGNVAAWQLWATDTSLDLDATDVAIKVSCTRAANGKIAATLAGAK